MAYTPKTEAELAKESLLPAGEYDATCIECIDRPSKKGNDMFTLKLQIFDPEGGFRVVFDYIVFGNPFGERKFRHAADAFGLIDVYSSGKLTAQDFVDCSCKIKLKIQDGTADFPTPKNAVEDYISLGGDDPVFKPVATNTASKDLDDDIPF